MPKNTFIEGGYITLFLRPYRGPVDDAENPPRGDFSTGLEPVASREGFRRKVNMRPLYQVVLFTSALVLIYMVHFEFSDTKRGFVDY